MTATAQLFTDAAQLSGVLSQWDALAVANRRPFCAPGWMLAWWASAAPKDASLRVVVVKKDDEVIGIAPMYVQCDRLRVKRFRFLSSPAALRTEPLAIAGSEAKVAALVASALSEAGAASGAIFFDGVSASSPWPDLFASHLSNAGSGWAHTYMRMPAPAVQITHASGDEWLASKSKNFREQTRRKRRKLEKEGAIFRMSTPETISSDLAALARLHHSRWVERGGSGVLTSEVETMLRLAAENLLASERFRLWVIDMNGAIVSAHLFLAAGGELSYWLGGFDDGWAAQQPALQVLVAALQDSIDRGEERLDLGGGAQSYKYRLSDSEEAVHWTTVIPTGRGHRLARLSTSPRHLRRAVLERIPSDLKDRVKKSLGRSVAERKTPSS